MKTEGAAASAFPYSLERTVSRRATRNSANNVTRLTTGWSGITVNKSWTGENETKRSRVARLRMYIVLDSLRNEELFKWKTYRQAEISAEYRSNEYIQRYNSRDGVKLRILEDRNEGWLNK